MASNKIKQGYRSEETRERKSKRHHGHDKSRDLMESQNIEYYKRLYREWGQIKEEAKEEEKARLKEKVRLQRELIIAQEHLSQVRKQEEEEELTKRRDADRAARKAKLDGLLGSIRRKSVARGDSTKNRTVPVDSADRLSDEQYEEYPLKISNKSKARKRNPKELTVPEEDENSSENFLENQENDPYSTTNDEKENGCRTGDDDNVFAGSSEPIPWHHAQLRILFPKQADYFLHPKIEMQRRISTKPKQLKDHVYLGSESLWSVLRNESNRKVELEDEKISPDLKLVYKAIMRQYVKDKMPKDQEELNDMIKLASIQIPEIKQLLDDSRMRKTQEERHQTQLMYRRSKKHEERTQILLHNNPISDVSVGNGRILHFMKPSTPEVDENWSEENSDREELGIEPELGKQDSDEPRVEKYHCIFLTEADAVTQGTFSKKKKDLQEAKNFDHLYNIRAEARTAYNQDSIVRRQKSVSDRRVSTVPTEKTVKKPEGKSWEPLTLGALMDYATSYSAPGQGNFAFGKAQMWPVL